MAATIQNLTRDNQTLTRDNQNLTRDNQNLTRDNQTLTRDNQTLTRDNQNLTTRLATAEHERDRFQNELRRAENISRELNQEKILFQRRCEQLEHEKMTLRNQITVCRRCTQRIN